jgi:hypothetical protein
MRKNHFSVLDSAILKCNWKMPLFAQDIQLQLAKKGIHVSVHKLAGRLRALHNYGIMQAHSKILSSRTDANTKEWTLREDFLSKEIEAMT